MKKLSTFLLLLSVFFHGCKDDDEKYVNQIPNTFFSIEEINLSGDNRLNSIVRLTWYGTDPDGYINGYELSQDGVSWDYTTVQDSTFRFSIDSGSDTSNIELFVRAIDNEGARDETPDRLIIPIKNTPPTASFDEALSIPDTVNLVATAEWKANDIDGASTITQVLISLNGDIWYELNKTKNIFSLVPADPKATGTTDALIYYNTENSPQAQKVPGLVMNDTNVIYLKSVDQAGTESKIDTSATFFMKGKTNDLLVVGGVPAANDDYANILSNGININYDFLDLAINNGENQPKLWNVTFRLQLLQYSKLFLYSNEALFDNTYTNVKGFILEFAAASLQEYANLGGKYFISTSFNWNTNIDAFTGVLPIRAVSDKNYGSARLYVGETIESPVDTMIVPADTTINGSDTTITPADTTYTPINNFPELVAQTTLAGVGVFNVDPQDTEVLYEANVVDGRPTTPWPDTKVIGSGRRVNGKLNQVFFNIQLYQLQGDQAAINSLFDQILNVEFN